MIINVLSLDKKILGNLKSSNLNPFTT